MPTKKDQFGPTLKTDDVFRVAELAALAEDWAAPGATFEIDHLNRYRELCAYYEVDPAVLLFVTQEKMDKENATERTGVFPQVGDLPEISGNA